MIWDRQERAKPNGVQDEAVTSNTALSAALNAFQSAGAQRKRAMTNGTLEREREREQEMQEEMQRQRRIREKGPGRRPNGKQKSTGTIDGEKFAHCR
jgi:exocyst complex component 4